MIQFCTVESLAKVKGGKRLPKGHDYSDTPTLHPYIRGEDIVLGKVEQPQRFLTSETAQLLRNYRVDVGDVVVTIAGTIGRVSLVPESLAGANLSENAAKITGVDGVDSRFLAYTLIDPRLQSQMHAIAAGAAQPKLGLYKIKILEIPVPNLVVQRRIADILSAYDDLIENNNRRMALLEESIHLLYREWFVYLRFPGHERVEIVDGVPEGWVYMKLGDLSDLRWGDTKTTKSAYVDTGFKAYSAAGPDGLLGHFDYERDGVVLSAIGAQCGKTWFATGRWSCIKNTIRFWSTHPYLSTEYLYCASSSPNFWPKRGAAQPFISQGDARNIQVLVPTESSARVFLEIVKPQFHQIVLLNSHNEKLREARDLLLPRLMDGRIPV